MTDLPDVKLRALVNFPVSVAGRTAVNVVKVSGRYYIDLDVSGLVQNPNISVGEVDQSWMIIWNEVLDAYQLVPYALAATAGVASLGGKTGALDIGYRLRFTGDTLEVDQAEFDTKNEAESYSPSSVYPSSIVLRGHTSIGDGAGGLFADLGTSPTHDLTVNVGTKTYVRIPAAVAEPASIYEVGVDPSDATPGWNRMIAAWKDSGYKDWYMPGGYVFNQRPDDINSRPTRDAQELYTFNLKGQGAYRTTFWKNYESSGVADGICNIRQNDVHISDIQFVSLVGSQTGGGVGSGCMISAVAPSFALGYCSLRDIDITSGGSAGNAFHDVGLYLDGRLGNTSGDHGFGIRGYELNNIKVFGGERGAAIFDNIVSLTWMGGGTFSAGGNSGALLFQGADKATPSAWSSLTTYLLGDYVASAGLNYRSLTTNLNKVPASNPSDWEAQVLPTLGAASSHVVLSTISGGVSFGNATGIHVQASQFDAGTITFSSTAAGCRTRGRLNTATVAIDAAAVDCFHNGTNRQETTASDGYIKHEDGRIEQWMVKSVTSSAVAYSFPIEFPTKCLICEVTPKGTTSSDHATVSSSGFTASQVSIIATGSITAYVWAVGY